MKHYKIFNRMLYFLKVFDNFFSCSARAINTVSSTTFWVKPFQNPYPIYTQANKRPDLDISAICIFSKSRLDTVCYSARDMYIVC